MGEHQQLPRDKIRSTIRKQVCLIILPFLLFILLLLSICLFQFLQYKIQHNHEISFIDIHQLNNLIKQQIQRSSIPTNIKSKYGYYHNNKDIFDPRLYPALSLNSLIQSTNINNNIDPTFSIPFSWDVVIARPSIDNLDSFTCLELTKYANLNSLLSQCHDVLGRSRTRFRIDGPIDETMSEQARVVVGYNYLMNSAPIPKQIMYLGAGGTDGVDSLMVPTSNSCSNSGSISALIERSAGMKDSISLIEVITSLRNTWNKHANSLAFILSNIPQSTITIIHLPNSKPTLSKSDFINTHLNTTHAEFKYFHESHVNHSSKGSHYDWRFFKQITYSPYERKAILHSLTRAWLHFAQGIGIRTWLAHGTLLGWYWNGINLPWDDDLDVQLPMGDMELLVKYNLTFVYDLGVDEGLNTGSGGYYLDVNPTFMNQGDDKGNNTIDARFIDVNSGMYVDITALGYSDASILNSTIEKQFGNKAKEFNQVIDNDFLEKRDSMTVDQEVLMNSLESKKVELLNLKNLFNCRDDHFYILEDLHPLRQTLFEGVRAWVPANYKRVLRREYPLGLRAKKYKDYLYRPVLRLWIHKDICKGDGIGNECLDEDTLLEFKYTGKMTQLHKNEMLRRDTVSYSLDDELESFVIYPWILHRARTIRES